MATMELETFLNRLALGMRDVTAAGRTVYDVTPSFPAGLYGVANVKDLGAAGDGTTDDTAAIQAALDAVPVTGGRVYFPPGTYRLTGAGVTCLGRSNLEIFGAGMGLTLLDGAEVSTPRGPWNFSSPLSLGEYGATAGAELQNLRLHDFSVKGAGTSATDKLTFFCGTDNVIVERVEYYDGWDEVLYNESGPFSGLTVRDCYFHDCTAQYGHCVNTNQLHAADILVEGCRFDTVTNGVFLLGENIRVVNNAFHNVTNVGVYIGEGRLREWGSFSSVVVSGNTFRGLGYVSPTGFAHSWSGGIFINSLAYAYPTSPLIASRQEYATIVANNTFLDGWDDKNLVCIVVQGGALVTGNYAAGVLTAGASRTYFSEFIRVAFSSDNADPDERSKGTNSTPVSVYLRDNVLEKRPSGNNFRTGIYAKCTQNAYLFLSGNVMEGEWFGAVCYDDANGNYPITVVMDGDRLGPYCLWGVEDTVYGAMYKGVDLGMGSSMIPVYGSTETYFTPTSWVPVLATGAGRTVDEVITVLQNLGLVKQS